MRRATSYSPVRKPLTRGPERSRTAQARSRSAHYLHQSDRRGSRRCPAPVDFGSSSLLPAPSGRRSAAVASGSDKVGVPGPNVQGSTSFCGSGSPSAFSPEQVALPGKSPADRTSTCGPACGSFGGRVEQKSKSRRRYQALAASRFTSFESGLTRGRGLRVRKHGASTTRGTEVERKFHRQLRAPGGEGQGRIAIM